PKRLFGFDGTANEDPSFSAGLVSPGGRGPSFAAAFSTIVENTAAKLQGGPRVSEGRMRATPIREFCEASPYALMPSPDPASPGHPLPLRGRGNAPRPYPPVG